MMLLDRSDVLIVEARGALDEPESRRVVAEVSDRATASTALIVVSLARVPAIRWNALCRLRSAALRWQRRDCAVIFETASPSQRFLLAALEIGTARFAAA